MFILLKQSILTEYDEYPIPTQAVRLQETLTHHIIFKLQNISLSPFHHENALLDAIIAWLSAYIITEKQPYTTRKLKHYQLNSLAIRITLRVFWGKSGVHVKCGSARRVMSGRCVCTWRTASDCCAQWNAIQNGGRETFPLFSFHC